LWGVSQGWQARCTTALAPADKMHRLGLDGMGCDQVRRALKVCRLQARGDTRQTLKRGTVLDAGACSGVRCHCVGSCGDISFHLRLV
jgi:hypothetical protein